MSLYFTHGFSGAGGAFGAACPQPTVYIQGRGCCLPASKNKSGKQACCAVNKTRPPKPAGGGKFSMLCGAGAPTPTTPSGGGGKCPSPATIKGGNCCYGSRCCSDEALRAGSIGFCSGRIACTAGASGYQPPLAQFATYPGASCNSVPGGDAALGTYSETEMLSLSEGMSWTPVLIIAGLIAGFMIFRKKETVVARV